MPMLSNQQYLSPSFAAAGGLGTHKDSQNSSTVSNSFVNRYVRANVQPDQEKENMVQENRNLPDSSHFQQKLKSLKSALDNVKTNVKLASQKTMQSPKNLSTSPFSQTKDLNTSAMISKTIDVWDQQDRDHSFTIDYQNTFESSLQVKQNFKASQQMNKSFDFNGKLPQNHRSSYNNLNRNQLDSRPYNQIQRSFSRVDKQNNYSQPLQNTSSDSSYNNESRTQNINNRSSALLLRLKQVPNSYELQKDRSVSEFDKSTSIYIEDQYKREMDFKKLQPAESLESTQTHQQFLPHQNQMIYRDQGTPISYPLDQSVINGTTIIHFSETNGMTTQSVSPQNVTQRDDLRQPVKIIADPLQSKPLDVHDVKEKFGQLESHNQILKGQVKEFEHKVQEYNRSEQMLIQQLSQVQQRNSELEEEILYLRTKNQDIVQNFKSLEEERNQMAETMRNRDQQMQRKEAYSQGLEQQISALQQDLDRWRQNNSSSSSDYLKMREFEKQLHHATQDIRQLSQKLEEKDRIIQDQEYRIKEHVTFAQTLQKQSTGEITMKTPAFKKRDQLKRKNHRNKSADIAALSSTDTVPMSQVMGKSSNNLRNTQSSFYYGNETRALKQSQSSFNLSGVQELLAIIGVSSIQELIQTFRKIQKDRKFCQKVVKLVKEVEGKRPETLKECWRWIRGLLQDFINLKSLLADQQRILKKIEIFFQNQNYGNNSSYQSSYNGGGGGSQVYSVREQTEYGGSGYNTRGDNMMKMNTIDGSSRYGQNTTNQIIPEIYNMANLMSLENAIDQRLKSYRL